MDYINQIIHGDCLEVMPTFPDKCFDMILCDLPYGTTACAWDVVIPFEPLWEQYKRIVKDNAAIVLTASQPFTSLLIVSNLGMFKHCWVWDKKKGGNPLLAKVQPIKVTEDVAVFGQGRITYNPIMKRRDKPKRRGKNTGRMSETTGNAFTEDKVYTHWYPKNILEFSNASQYDRLHPTQKPVDLFEYLIRTYTNEGDLILDNCIGSGTTAVAAENLGRSWIGIEKEAKYVEIANARIAKERLKRSQLSLGL